MKVINAVAYARYSSDKQQESSITVQLAEIKKFCAFHGIHLIREYIDEAQTGTNSNRKYFQQMIKDAPQKEFQLVIVHRMDRWARNVDDARYYKKYLKKYGIKIVSAIEEFDETPEGEFFELMSMGMAELYSKKLARECIAGKLANAKEGKAHGGTPPLGYRVNRKYYVIDEKEAEAVKIIFEMVLQGYGYTYIRDYLNANGYRHTDGRLFTSHFYDILRNRKYIGEYVYNRVANKDLEGKRNNHREKSSKDIIRISGAMPKIIDEETFNKVQAILDERKRNARTIVKPPSNKYLLTGLTRCRMCGRAICGSMARKDDYHYRIYSCIAKGRKCTTRVINADYFEDYIHSLLFGCLLLPDNAEQLCKLIEVAYLKAHDKLQDSKQELIEELNAFDSKIETIRSEFSQDESKQLMQFLTDECDRLQSAKRELQYNIELVNKEICAFPDYNPITIRRTAKNFYNILKDKQFINLQETYRKLISSIKVDNETVQVVLKLNELLGSYIPITVTILERRDYIARHENLSLQSLAFSSLSVRVA